MKTDAIDLDTLPDDPKVLKALMGKMMQRMNWLEEQFRLAQHQRFDANGEAHLGQGELFNEAEDIHATQGVESDIDTESETTTVTYERQQAITCRVAA
jgi:transposase